MSEHTFTVGDRVICNPAETPAQYHGTVYTVERVNRVNVVLQPLGGGRGLRIHPSLLLPAPPDAGGATVTLVPLPPPPLVLGAVVTIASPRWRGTTGLYVVLADHGDTVKVVLLGGDNNKYWPKVPRGWVTEMDRGRLLGAVAGLTGGTR